MEDIPLVHTFKEIQLIKKGMSSDRKYFITTKNNESLLLRISDLNKLERRKAEYELLKRLSAISSAIPEPIDFGICCNGTKIYTLLSWADGQDAESVVPNLTTKEQYSLGRASGKILRKIHSLPVSENTECWEVRYFAVIDERLEAFRKEGIPFDGCSIDAGVHRNKQSLLHNRLQTYHHGDYHMGNMIISPGWEAFLLLIGILLILII